MPSERNLQQVELLKERLARCTIIIATGFTGLDATAMTDLRRRLRERGVEYRVAKNTLTRIAASQVGKEALGEILQGSTGLVLGYGEPLDVAKAVDEFVRTTRLPVEIRGALLEGRILGGSELAFFASLPPRPQLMGQLASRLVTLAAILPIALNAPLQGLAVVLQRYVQKQPAAAST